MVIRGENMNYEKKQQYIEDVTTLALGLGIVEGPETEDFKRLLGC